MPRKSASSCWLRFFPVFLNALGGFRCVTAQDDELARSLDLPRWAYVACIAAPAAVPSLVTGVRLGGKGVEEAGDCLCLGAGRHWSGQPHRR